VTSGSENCIRAEDVLGTGATESANGTWIFFVQNSSGDSVFPFASEYVLGPGATYFVTLGFTQPAFVSRTVNACTPTYAKGYIDWDYYPRADTFTRTALNLLPGGFMAQARNAYEASWDAGVTAWSERAYLDCRGFTCDNDDCRKDSDQYVVRVEGQPRVHDSHLSDGTWWRQVDRPYTEFTLSRMFFVNNVGVSGHAQYTSSAHLTTNITKHDELFDLSIEAPTVSYSTRSNINPPNNGVRYTKGTLP